MKSILKEIIIVLLLVVAILLILAILFYDSIPMNKVVPTEISRTSEIPEELVEEINSVLDDEKETVITYKVDAQIIDQAQKDKDLIQGKEDPFAEVSAKTGGNNGNGGNGNNGNEVTNTPTTGEALSKGGGQPEEKQYNLLQK